MLSGRLIRTLWSLPIAICCACSFSPPNSRSFSSSPPVSTSLVYSDIDDGGQWSQCQNGCADSGGTGPQPQTNQGLVATPSQDGSAHWFWIGGAFSYANSYWYVQRTGSTNPPNPQALAIHHIYSFALWIPAGEESNPQAIEWELHQQFHGWVYNAGWQALYVGSGDPTKMLIRTFQWNPTPSGPAKGWYSTGVLIPQFSPNTWHQVQVENHIANNTVYFDDIVVDSVTYIPNSPGASHQAIYAGPSYTDKFNNAVQLDLNNAPLPYDVYLDNMKITYWTQ